MIIFVSDQHFMGTILIIFIYPSFHSCIFCEVNRFCRLYAITSQLSPVPSPSGGSSSGIQVLVTDTFKLQSFQTSTGVKFYLIAEPNAPNLDQTLKTIYELYTDYVLKVISHHQFLVALINPFFIVRTHFMN